MHLSFGDKAHILTSNFSFWIGAFFLLIGSITTSSFLPQTDFASLQFYAQPVALTDGYTAAAEATDCSEDDAPILAIYYRYQVDNRKLFGYSYSSELSAKPGEKVQVEYLANQPESSRITGTRKAPYAPWVGLFVLLGPVVGLTLLYKAYRQSQTIFAIIHDAQLVTANYERTRTTTEGVDGATVYYLIYSYQYANMTYNYTTIVNDPAKYEADILVFIQHSEPANVILANELPISIRERLLSLTKR